MTAPSSTAALQTEDSISFASAVSPPGRTSPRQPAELSSTLTHDAPTSSSTPVAVSARKMAISSEVYLSPTELSLSASLASTGPGSACCSTTGPYGDYDIDEEAFSKLDHRLQLHFEQNVLHEESSSLLFVVCPMSSIFLIFFLTH